jgi:hypothetical protein
MTDRVEVGLDEARRQRNKFKKGPAVQESAFARMQTMATPNMRENRNAGGDGEFQLRSHKQARIWVKYVDSRCLFL